MDMDFYCTLRDAEFAGDLLVAQATANKARDLAFASRQTIHFLNLMILPRH